MQTEPASRPVVRLTNLSNREFLERYAACGRIGLSGGTTLVDQAICRAQRHLDENAKWGLWSHAFFFQGARADGHHWVIESDLQAHHKHIQWGVQENRVEKYWDEKAYTRLAVLDFGVTPEQVSVLLREALGLVANRARYSLRELVGTLIALRHTRWRGRDNLLARQRSMYCSAFVHHLFRQAKLDLAPGVHLKNTTPEHLARTSLPHQAYVLDREPAPSTLERPRIERGVRTSLARLKRLAGRERSRSKRL
jgi:hypothetical protein